MKHILILISLAIISLTPINQYLPSNHSTQAPTEQLNCTIQSLSSYGFVQQSDYQEYVCSNPSNYTDFVIIVDEHSEYNLNDSLTITLNKHNEVLTMSHN